MHGEVKLAWATATAAELKTLTDPIGNGILVLEVHEHSQFRFLSLNLTLENMVGFKHSEVSGLFLNEVLSASDLAIVTARYQRCVDAGERIEVDSASDLPDIDYRWQTTLTPIFNADGAIVRLLASTIEYTHRHRLEAELRQTARQLRESQNRLQWAITGGEIGIWEWDVSNRLIWMADSWPAHMKTNVSSQAMSADSWMELVHPDYRAHATAVGMRTVAGKIPAYNIEYQVKLLNGQWQWRHIYGTVTERDEHDQVTRICGTYQDITQKKKDQEKLRKLTEELKYRATHDSLTSAMNRGEIVETLKKELMRAERDSSSLTVALLDVDHFKLINDQYGHPVGDQVLITMVERIRVVLRPYDHVGRYGGEEFLILAPSKNGIAALHERIRNAIANPSFSTTAGQLDVTASIGVALYKGGETDTGKLLTAADDALYRAKRLGRNRVVLAE